MLGGLEVEFRYVDHIGGAQVPNEVAALHVFDGLKVGAGKEFVVAISGFLNLASLPLGLLHYYPLVGLTPQALKVIVEGSSPLGPREVAAPPDPRIADSCGSWIVDMTPVSFDHRPAAAAGETQVGPERFEGRSGFAFELIPEFS